MGLLQPFSSSTRALAVAVRSREAGHGSDSTVSPGGVGGGRVEAVNGTVVPVIEKFARIRIRMLSNE